MNNANDRLDCLIGLAMFDYAKEYEEEYDAIDTSGVVIDERFDRRIYKLIGKKEREPKIRKVRKISFRVAVAAMLIMSIMFLTMLLVSGIREAIWQVIVKWYDDHITVSFVQTPTVNGVTTDGTGNIHTDSGNGTNEEQSANNAEIPGTVETPTLESTQSTNGVSGTENTESTENAENTEKVENDRFSDSTTAGAAYPVKILEYRKPVLSNEYVEYEGLKDASLYIVDYCIGDEWIFGFQQSIKEIEEQHFDNTGKQVKNVEIGGFAAVLILSNDNEPNIIVWNDGEYLYTINGFLDENELISIASTVK